MNTTHKKNTTGLIRKWFTRGVACMALLFAGQSAHAATRTWSNASGGDFNTAGNWTGGVPVAADVGLFNIALGNVTLSAPATPGSLSFDTNASTFTLGALLGNSLTFAQNGNLSVLSTLLGTGKTFTVNAPIVLTPSSTTGSGAFTIQNNATDASNTLVVAGGISGSTTSNTETLTLGGSNTGNNTISGVISKGSATTFTVAKSGAGTWILTGANTYNGATTVNRGTLLMDMSGSGALASTSALTLGGGNFHVKGKTGAFTTAQTLGALGLTASTGSTITLDPNGGTSTTLTLGNAWARGAGSTLLVDTSSANTGTRNVKTTAAITGTGAAVGSLLNYVVVKDATGTGFGLQDGSYNIVRKTTGFTTLTTINSVAGSTALDFTTSGVLTLDNVAHAANTLSIDSTGGGTLDLGGAQTLTLTAKGIFMTGSGNYTIQTGTVGAAASEVIVHQMGSGTLTINSLIGSTSASLTKDGAGTLILGNSNTYTGATVIHAGTLTLTNQNAVQNSTVTMGGGASGAVVFDSSVVGNAFTFGGLAAAASGAGYDISLLNNAGTPAPIALTVGGNSVNTTYAGILSGSGGSLIKTGAGTLILSGANTFSGNIYINAGTLCNLLGAQFNYPAGSGNFGSGAGTIYLGQDSSSIDATLAVQDNSGYSPSTNPNSTNPIVVQSGSGARIIRVLAGVTSKSWIGGDITLNNNLQFIYNTTAGVDLRISGNITGTGNLTFASTTGGSPISLTGASINPVGIITNSSGSTGASTISGTIGSNVTAVVQNSTSSKLILSGTNNLYAGTTTVILGTLETTKTNSLGVASSLVIADGAKMYLNFTGTNTITSLKLGNVNMPKGIYGTNAPPDKLIFSGLGALKVLTGPANGTLIRFY